MPLLDLTKRRILAISPKFFGYERRIVDRLVARGASVEWLDERPGNSVAFKATLRLSPALMAPVAERYYSRALERLTGRAFDDILLISPESCTHDVVRRIRRCFPGARLILYMWDSFSNKKRRDVPGFIRLFDRPFTFDSVDAIQYGIPLRPLFYSSETRARPQAAHAYAFSFIGTIHSDRYRILSSLCRDADRAALSYFVYPYLPSRLIYWVYRIAKPEFWGKRLEDFRFQPMPYSQVLEVMDASAAVIDVEHPRQRGLTMRTLEVLGAGKKLITTNAHIRDYPFFDPERICIIDRKRAEIDPNFFSVPPPPLDPSFARECSLDGWIDALFGDSSVTPS